ncbi:MAG: M48 family metallopeptidase [Dehalococcoidales bacterium]|nr:M48 family metallopeptidase [Dehalococcoidales bacterium]
MKRDILPKISNTIKKSAKPVIVGEYEIELKSRKIKYVLKRSQKARLVWLKIGQGKGLSVTVPASYDLANLNSYLAERTDWILHNLDKFSAAPEQPDAEKKAMPDKISYLGKCYILKKNNRMRGFTAVSQDNSILSFNLCTSFDSSNKEGLKKWLKDQARGIINEKVKLFGRKLKVTYYNIYIKDQKSIWGSCSNRKNLSFNWRLIMVPENVIDYVVIHELCHLKEMNHSRSFWKQVAEYCPKWRLHRKWLNEHCNELRKIL